MPRCKWGWEKRRPAKSRINVLLEEVTMPLLVSWMAGRNGQEGKCRVLGLCFLEDLDSKVRRKRLRQAEDFILLDQQLRDSHSYAGWTWDSKSWWVRFSHGLSPGGKGSFLMVLYYHKIFWGAHPEVCPKEQEWKGRGTKMKGWLSPESFGQSSE